MTVRMPVADCPRVEEVLPHAGPMVFLSRVLSHTDDHTVCSVEIDEQALFRDRTGNVPAWVAFGSWVYMTIGTIVVLR